MNPDRRELERLAFSKPTTEREAAAAAEALRRLVDADAVAAAAEVPAAVEPQAAAGPPGVAGESSGPSFVPPVKRRRTLLPLVVVAGLVVGLAAGILVTRDGGSPLSASATPTAVPSTSAPVLGATTNALAQLATPRTPRDVFPVPISTIGTDIESDSVRRILTTADGVTLWIGRGPQDICMMFTIPAGKIESGATCTSIFQFSDTGLHLSDGNHRWDWNGSTFSTTVHG